MLPVTSVVPLLWEDGAGKPLTHATRSHAAGRTLHAPGWCHCSALLVHPHASNHQLLQETGCKLPASYTKDSWQLGRAALSAAWPTVRVRKLLPGAQQAHFGSHLQRTDSLPSLKLAKGMWGPAAQPGAWQGFSMWQCSTIQSQGVNVACLAATNAATCTCIMIVGEHSRRHSKKQRTRKILFMLC